MRHTYAPRRGWRRLVLALSTILCLAALPVDAQPRPAPPAPESPHALQQAFASAAREFGVPEPVLLSVAYNLSRWESHGGAPSVAGGYGPLHLTEVPASALGDARGGQVERRSRPDPNDPALHTLATAAGLLGVSPALLKRDPAQNIRGGAALLAQYARHTTGGTPARLGDWYGAVAQYSGSSNAAVARGFADAVYETIQQGAQRTTSEGQQVSLPATPATPNRSTAAALQLKDLRSANPVECPVTLVCEFIPAAYTLNNPNDLSDYGNYDLAARPSDGLDIRYIIIHNTEISYDLTLRVFQNPLNYVSSHYVIRSVDGHIAQMVPNHNVPWHAGNWYMNAHAIGIEHEGIAIYGATWYTEAMYRSSAQLVRYLARRFNIPLDRAHILGHDEYPGPLPAHQPGMHWDPGPFWDWAHYMELVGRPLAPPHGRPDSPVVTINPNFATNRPHMTYCYTNEASDCHDVPAQGANFVYLHTQPSHDSPLITNQYISAEPTRANNWANKAVTGQQFYRVDSQGDWDAIYFGGQVAWFYNPTHASYTFPRRTWLVTPKTGRASIPVYGRAYPEAGAYPPGVPAQSITPIYEIPAGQVYVATDLVNGTYYYAPTYTPSLEDSDHTVVTGQTQYYQIFFNHRLGFVKADDIERFVPR